MVHTNLGQSSEPGPHPGVGHLAYKVFKKTHKITNARSDSSSISRWPYTPPSLKYSTTKSIPPLSLCFVSLLCQAYLQHVKLYITYDYEQAWH